MDVDLIKSTGKCFDLLCNVRNNGISPSWDDCTRGILVALVQERSKIWNPGEIINKADVINNFCQISEILSNKDPNFHLWAVIEKWCWMVELYMRSISAKAEWRYNNSLRFLLPFVSQSYPYVNNISNARLISLTKSYESGNCWQYCSINVADQEESPISPIFKGLFRSELAFYVGETETNIEIDRVAGSATPITRKTRGRPCKDKNLKIEASPQEEDEFDFDELGINKKMYNVIINTVKNKPEIWYSLHPQYNNTQLHDNTFEEISNNLKNVFGEKYKDYCIGAMSGSKVAKGWSKLSERFHKEDANYPEISNWKFYGSLNFLSTRVMPIFLKDVAEKNSEEATTSGTITPNTIKTEPLETTQMVLDTIATSANNNNKTIKSVLESLIASKTITTTTTTASTTAPDEPTDQLASAALAEIQKLLAAGCAQPSILMNTRPSTSSPGLDIASNIAPPPKRNRIDSPSGVTSPMVVINDNRKTAPVTISTWVPPKEDTIATSSNTPVRSKFDSQQLSPTKNGNVTVTAVIKSNSNVEKQLRKMQQSIAANTSTPQVKNFSSLNQWGSINNVVSNKKAKSPPLNITNSNLNGTGTPNTSNNSNNVDTTSDDKWSLLGKMIASTAREIERKDPILACHLFKELQEVLYNNQLKSITPILNQNQQLRK